MHVLVKKEYSRVLDIELSIISRTFHSNYLASSHLLVMTFVSTEVRADMNMNLTMLNFRIECRLLNFS